MGWPGPGRRQQAGASRRARARQAPAGRQAGRRQQGSASRGARRARARPAPAGAHPPATQGTPATAARKAHATGAAMHPCTQPCLVPGHPGAHAGLQHPEATGAACHHPCTLAQQRTHLRLQRTHGAHQPPHARLHRPQRRIEVLQLGVQAPLSLELGVVLQEIGVRG